MEDFNSESDSDYTSYWRDWVGQLFDVMSTHAELLIFPALWFCLQAPCLQYICV